MKTYNIYNKVSAAIAATLMLSLTSCVKDDIYETSHPEYGKLTITPDWSNRGNGIDVPAKWCCFIKDDAQMTRATETTSGNTQDYYGEETTATHTPDRLFAPGVYTLLTYNPTADINVNGTTATAIYTGSHNIEWFFTDIQSVAIDGDRDYDLKATMRQQVRQLSIVMEAEGDAIDRIIGIDATLSGVASTLDFAANTYGTPTTMPLSFRKSDDGKKWIAVTRLLGVTDQPKDLTATIHFADDNPQPITVTSDITQSLDGFNDGKPVPLALGTKIVTSTTESGVTAVIEKWQQLDGWDVDAY